MSNYTLLARIMTAELAGRTLRLNGRVVLSFDGRGGRLVAIVVAGDGAERIDITPGARS